MSVKATKKQQGFCSKPACCKHCTNRTFETEKGYMVDKIHEVNHRCKLGGFAVKLMNTCNLFARNI